MVRTRHTPDVNEESPGIFLSIDKRRSRLTRNVIDSDEGSDDSGVVQFKNGKKAGGKRQHEETPLGKRSLRTSAKRVSYVEDYIDDFPRIRTRGRTGRAVIDDETDDDNIEVKMDGSPGPAETDSWRATRSRRRDTRSPVTDMDDDDQPRRRTRRSYDLEARNVKAEALNNIEENGIRRSSRPRKLISPSFDQKVMEQSGYAEDEHKTKRARREVDADDAAAEDDSEYKDMYSRVKRKRKSIKRDMYGMPIEESDEEENEEDDSDDESDEDSDEDDDNNEDGDDNDDENDNEETKSKEDAPRSYYLRQNKPRTQLYNAPINEKRPRTMSRLFNDMGHHSPARRRRPEISSYMSPARKMVLGSRRRAAFHGSSSTSSSSSESSDEERFQRRKAKSMRKSRQRCLPMNFNPEAISGSSILRDRQKVGSSLADVDPMTIDRSITFNSVGGLGKHVRALKEMVVFPLMYPEIFERFKISPPRGVLFYGPPGTGKTLVARALANECSNEDRRVAFYMRKGADCLSKWVGESERQLRLLFDQAYQTRPSIIFFDEIDGLAPVRSSRQDQIHSSIVSTLLALMDGLDSRGEIVVIGATNRIDSIDPALRRPGRFDREFLFPLPSVQVYCADIFQARSQILKIHTKDWNPKLCGKFVDEVAEHCTGYCGADMKALCTEAALLALRRRYPQIYTSTEKLQIDVSSINVIAKDFYLAMKNIVPTSQRSLVCPGRALNSQIAPLLQALFQTVIEKLNQIFPSVLSQLANLDTASNEEKTSEETELDEDENESAMAIYEQRVDRRRKNITDIPEKFLNFTSYANKHPSTHRPRLLLSGNRDQGQTSHLAPAVLHHMEQLPVHVIDLSTLFAVSARTPEEGCAQIFREARRTAPSIVYLPHINQWWTVIPDTVKMTLLTLMQDIDPSSPLLILATSEEKYIDLDYSLQDVFDEFSGEVTTMRNPNSQERTAYFRELLLSQATKAPPQKKVIAERLLEVLPKAPPPEPRKLTDQELKKVHEHEEATLRELRLFLRDVLNKLGRDRKFFIFTKPVDVEDVPDYYEIIQTPMDLSTMMTKIDLHQYTCVKEFMEDIEQICMNALEYNPDKDPQSRVIRHRACALRDTSYAIMKVELDPEFEKICLGIVESRKKRGDDGSKTVPSFYHTKRLYSGPSSSTSLSGLPSFISDPSTSPMRLSQRLRRGNVDDGPSLEEVERTARILRREAKQHGSPEKKNEATNSQESSKEVTPCTNKNSGSKQSQGTGSEKRVANNERTTSGKKKAKKCIWGRSGYKRRRRKRKRDESELKDEEEGEEVNSEDDNEEMEESEGETVEDDGEFITESSQSQTSHDTRSRRDSLSKCLSVDVNMKLGSDNPRSPNQRSPRGESQRSPVSDSRSQMQTSPVAHSEPVLRLSRLDSGQKSPRCRHTSGQLSPRVHETVNSISSESHIKSARLSLAQKFQDKSIPPDSVLDICENSNHTTAQESITQDKSVAPSEAEGIPVVNGFIDSGVGSSDSNGDSNDSGGKLTSSQISEKSASKDALQVSTSMENGDQSLSENKQAPSPQFRVTRSRIQTKTQEKALEILQSQMEPLIIDMERLVKLLDLTVTLTEGYDIAKLEKLYSIFGQCIYQHRLEFNKTIMCEMMEKHLLRFTASVKKRLEAEEARTLSMS